MQHFVTELVNEGAEKSSAGCLSGKNGDLPAVAHAQRGCDGFLELKLDALGNDEVEQAFAVLAYLSGRALGELGSSAPSVWLTSKT